MVAETYSCPLLVKAINVDLKENIWTKDSPAHCSAARDRTPQPQHREYSMCLHYKLDDFIIKKLYLDNWVNWKLILSVKAFFAWNSYMVHTYEHGNLGAPQLGHSGFISICLLWLLRYELLHWCIGISLYKRRVFDVSNEYMQGFLLSYIRVLRETLAVCYSQTNPFRW